MELARQVVAVHEAQYGSHKTGLKFSLTIDMYSIISIFKAREMEEGMRKVTTRLFKERRDFDYRGMRNKLKKAYVHVHRIEDIWTDQRTEQDIKKLDYCQLTLDQIQEFNLVDILDDLEEDGNVIDLTYVENKVSSTPLPLIQWSNKESTSIKDRFQSISTLR